MPRSRWLALTVAISLVAAFGTFASQVSPAAAACTMPPLTDQSLLNGMYTIPASNNQNVTFTLNQGAATLPDELGTVHLDPTHVAFGDLNGDGCDDALVILAYEPGGSGTFIFAIPMVNQGGTPRQAGIQFLGDRVQIQSVSIAAEVGTVAFLTQGPNDPLCCPTQPAMVTIHVPMGAPVQMPSTSPTAQPGTGQMEATPLIGTPWRMVQNFDAGALQPLVAGTSVTATFRTDGTVSGSAGCNSYQGSFTVSESAISIGPLAATLMACADAATTAQEAAYLRNLNNTASFVIVGPQLQLRGSDGSTLVVYST